MRFRIVGRPFGNAQQPKDKVTENADGSMSVESTYRTLYNGWLGRAPNLGASHSIYPDARLDQRDAQQITPGFLCDVTLRYKAPAQETGDPGGGGTPLPPDEYTESVNDVEFPIESHPNFATLATEANGAIFFDVPLPKGQLGPPMRKFDGWTKNSPYSGHLTFKVGSVTESVTTYYWGKPPSVSTVVGTRDGNWLTISGAISRKGIYWTRTINRIYSKVPWPPAIYP